MIFKGIVLDICSISFIIFLIFELIKYMRKSPDHQKIWEIDYKGLYNRLQRFVDKQEKVYGVINVLDAQQRSKSGSSENGFAIITNEACYFVGKVYQKKWKFLFRTNVQWRIAINELKGIKIENLSRLAIPSILSAILTILDIKWLIYVFREVYEHEELYYGNYGDRLGEVAVFTILIAFIMFCLAIFCFVRAYIVKGTYMSLEFTSSTVSFPTSKLIAQEIDDFYKAVSEVQGQNSGTVTTGGTPNATAREDKIQSLSELSKLYEQGMISEEEFHKLKAEVISK